MPTKQSRAAYRKAARPREEVKIIYHRKIPTKFCTIFLLSAAVMWIRDLRSLWCLFLYLHSSQPFHKIPVYQGRIPQLLPCLALQDTFSVAGYWEILWPLIGNSAEEVLLVLIFLFVEEERQRTRQNLLWTKLADILSRLFQRGA